MAAAVIGLYFVSFLRGRKIALFAIGLAVGVILVKVDARRGFTNLGDVEVVLLQFWMEARLRIQRIDPDKNVFVSFEGAFHGRTMGAQLAANEGPAGTARRRRA